jgi:hypothetical protein
MISLYPIWPRICLIKYCIEKEKRCYLLNNDYGATMVSLITTIVAMVPMVAMLSLSAFMYKWEILHLEAESRAEEYIYTCRNTAHKQIHLGNINEISQDQRYKMVSMLTSCDDGMLYYKGRCELNPGKIFCSKSILEGYLALRGLEHAERPAAFTMT